MTERINISKNFMNKSPEKYLEKLKFYYIVHGKSISEFSPDLNILLRRFVIKKIYDLSELNTTIKKKCEEFLNSICGIEKAKNISLNFDPEKICKYEDYISFIEKSFQQAEDDFNENILGNNFDNYLNLIAVYRLICDISDLIDCWKEKDEKIEKFQKLCKYRCIQIITAKKEYEKGPQSEIDKEIKEMEKELIMNQTLYKNNENNKKKEKNDNISNLNEKKTNNDIKDNNKKNVQNDKIKNIKMGEVIFPKDNYVTNFIDIKQNNPYLNLTLNFKENYEKKKNEINKDDNNENKEKFNPISFQLVDNPYNSILSQNSIKTKKSILPPKKVIVKQIDNEQLEIENMLNNLRGNNQKVNSDKTENQNQNVNKNKNINKNNKDINQKNKDLKDNNKNINENNKDLTKYKDSNQNNKDLNKNKNKNKDINKNKNKDSNENNNKNKNKDINKNKNKDSNEKNKDLNQNNKDSNQNNKDLNNKDINENKNKNSNQNNIVINNKNLNQNKNKDTNKNKNIDINENNKDSNQNNNNLNKNKKNDNIKEKPFKQLKSNLLKDYKYPGNKQLDINIPVNYRDVDYIYLLDYLKKKLIPDTISKIEKNDIKNALSESEMLLYYLTNIKSKDSDM